MDLSYLINEDHTPTIWDNMFFSEAVLWSRMSHDTQTQCGCVLVKNKATISTGYNGFMRDINDLAFPTKRPEKYPFMIHAEANAVYNAAREGKSTVGATAYVTAPPCTNCLQMLWQCGIQEIYFSDLSSPKQCFYGDVYGQVLGQITQRIKFLYVPKRKLTDIFLKESSEKFSQND
jgi:dCMP deaminase